MQLKTEKQLLLYSAMFIAIVFNGHKLVALRETSFLARYWHFNGYELLFETCLNFVFCIAVAFITLKIISFRQRFFLKMAILVIANLFLLVITDVVGITIQKRLFVNSTPSDIFRAAYTLRLLASAALEFILVRIIILLQENKAKDIAHEQLSSAYLNVQMGLLKEQLNPHFFFNALSSLSAIVRENPVKAQLYISHLSKMFRYSLQQKEKDLVPLKEELSMIDSYSALQKMRWEDGIIMDVTIFPDYYNRQLPYMSLQPLLENAVKHNTVSATNPLFIHIYTEENFLVIQNNLVSLRTSEKSSGTGLANLNERYRILLHKEIEINKDKDYFTVKLPLSVV